MIINVRMTFCVLAIVSLTSWAFAADTEDDNRLDGAWEGAIGDQEPILTEKQFAMLNNLAFQAAVTKVCDGFALDQTKFSNDLQQATSPAPQGLSDQDIKAWETAVLIRFGTTYGLLLAEGDTNPVEFCASAAELKADTDISNVWQ